MPHIKIITVPLAQNLYQKLITLLNWIYIRIFKNNKYVTERYRPINFKKVDKNFIDKTSDVAFLLRGQIIKTDEFTKNTLMMYRLRYPNAPIYLSTWKYCIDDKFLSFAKCNNIKVISTKYSKPKSGYKSDNLQIISNVKGLQVIIKDKIKYTITTRTDQRFYANNIPLYLKNIISLYSYKKTNPKDKQINRLIGMSFDTFLYRLYGLGDMFLFGLTEDVYNYWNSSLDSRIISSTSKNKKNTILSLNKVRVSEVYFMTEFLKRNGHSLKWTLDDYLGILRNRFIIVDSYSFDFLWPKYSFFEERFKDFEDIRYKEISHFDWLLIKNQKIKVNKEILNKFWD